MALPDEAIADLFLNSPCVETLRRVRGLRREFGLHMLASDVRGVIRVLGATSLDGTLEKLSGIVTPYMANGSLADLVQYAPPPCPPPPPTQCLQATPVMEY